MKIVFNPFTGTFDHVPDVSEFITGVAWGDITGTLSDQADLQTALDAKQDELSFPLAANLGGTGVANAVGSTLTLGGATSITGGGTVALGGYTLTVPDSDLTIAGTNITQTFTAAQEININSTTALLVEQDGVKDNVLVVDTTNGRVGLNKAPSLGALDITGGIFSTTQNKIDGTADEIQLIVQANPTQTANLTEWQNSSGTVLSGVDERGVLFSNGGIDVQSVIIGYGAGNPGTATGTYNVLIGRLVGSAATTGTDNVGIGRLALRFLTEGSYNFGLGSGSLTALTTGNSNVGLGHNTGSSLQTGSNNLFIGQNAGQSATDSNNTLIGSGSGSRLTSGASNIFLGRQAGNQQTTNSNLLIIDNQQRASAAVEATNAILYGTMAATPGSQSLQINADLIIPGTSNNLIETDYSADKIGFFGVTPITQPTEITDELTTITFTAPGTPDYAIQDLVAEGGAGNWGFATQDEGNTALSVIANLQTRVNELETVLSTLGLVADAD